MHSILRWLDLDLDEVDSRKRVMWDGLLNVTTGDEIKIQRGYIMREIYDSDIRATTINNLTKGIIFKSKMGGGIFDPPLRGARAAYTPTTGKKPLKN